MAKSDKNISHILAQNEEMLTETILNDIIGVMGWGYKSEAKDSIRKMFENFENLLSTEQNLT